jgi:flagellar biosynthesis protein FlhA
MLILPMPTWLLDFCLIVNLCGALLVLLAAVNTRRPLDFSLFPSLLLITTLFRLALEVSALKLILGNRGDAGRVIAAFGQAVLGENYVVGFLVFTVIVVVQFVVITAGATRVAEVSARFTLDALPGKQMAIDADLSSGSIDQATAHARRVVLQREADFYGAMDGASKFVRGDAIAAVIIMLLNITGGMIIGMVTSGGDLSGTLHTYTLLTVGQGLVTQIPALLISTAAGLMVTRAGSDGDMGTDLSRQIFSSGRLPLFAAALICLLLPLGFPAVQTLVVAGILCYISWTIYQRPIAAGEGPSLAESLPDIAAEPPALSVDALAVDIGYGLMPLVERTATGGLLGLIGSLRDGFARDYGLTVPSVRVKDDLSLRPNEYVIRLRGAPVARGQVRPNSVLAVTTPHVTAPIGDGVQAVDPSTGRLATWLQRRHSERAEAGGYQVMEPEVAIARHLERVIQTNAAEMMTRQATQTLLDRVKSTEPALISELSTSGVSVSVVQKVFQHLLREQISIRDTGSILEAVLDGLDSTHDPSVLGEMARESLAREICATTLGRTHGEKLRAVVLDIATESAWSGDNAEAGSANSRLDSRKIDELCSRLTALKPADAGLIFLTDPVLRLDVSRALSSRGLNLPVLSYAEVADGVDVEIVSEINVEAGAVPMIQTAA